MNNLDALHKSTLALNRESRIEFIKELEAIVMQEFNGDFESIEYAFELINATPEQRQKALNAVIEGGKPIYPEFFKLITAIDSFQTDSPLKDDLRYETKDGAS